MDDDEKRHNGTESPVIENNFEPENPVGEEKNREAFIKNYVIEWEARHSKKLELRKRNLESGENRPDESFFRKLDSSLKRNTTFVKKLKTFTESQREQLIREFGGLNLSKYVAEIATAMMEVKLKMLDVPGAVELCSLAHQRYGDFAISLLDEWRKVLPRKKTDKIVNPSKIRVDVRFFAELIVCGVLEEKEALPMLGAVLAYLTETDKDQANMAALSSFCKYCGEDYAGLVPKKLNEEAVNLGLRPLPKSEIFSAERQKSVRTLLEEYYLDLEKQLVHQWTEVCRIERQNYRQLMTKGEVHPEATRRFEDAAAAFHKFQQGLTPFAEVIGRDMPQFSKQHGGMDEDEVVGTEAGAGESEGGAAGGKDSDLGPLWEDEDMRLFYEHLPELRSVLPGILFKDSEQPTLPVLEDKLQEEEEGAENKDLDEDLTEPVEQVPASKEEVEPEAETSEGKREDSAEPGGGGDEVADAEEDDLDGEGEAAAAGADGVGPGSLMKSMMALFVSTLPNMINRDMIDQAAMDFVTNLNTKGNRKRLVRALYGVHRNRQDLLPFYGRLVATLCPVMPDVGTELVQWLLRDFRKELRKKDQVKVESKVKIVRFLGELVKFRICPKSEILTCYKMLLFDFRHHNIDMACALVDVCGYFLQHSPDSHPRMRVLLDQMMRKKQALHLQPRYAMMVDNAYYSANPPTGGPAPKLQRPPMHQYIRRLLFKDLSKSTIEKALKQLRKLDWNEVRGSEGSGVCDYAIRCLSSPWQVKYSSVQFLASLLAGLIWYYEFVGQEVVDNLLEDIRIGMEINQAKLNQRRVSCVKYLGELYNYRCVDSGVIFGALYSLITFGVDSPHLDPPEHLFRIRLACILLETCGHYFHRGTSKKKLDCYVAYLERYYWRKHDSSVWNSETHPFPLETQNLFVETMMMLFGSDVDLCKGLTEAESRVEQMEAKFRAKVESLLTFVSPQEGDEKANEIGDGDRHIHTIAEEDEYDDEDEEEGEMAGRSLGSSREPSQFTPCDNSQPEHAGGEGGGTGEDHLSDEAEDEEEEEQVRVRAGGAREKEVEDQDFLSAFDKMMTETLQHRATESAKVPQVDMTLPASVKSLLKTTRFEDDGETVEEPDRRFEVKSDKPRETVPFVLMTKGSRGTGKPSFRTLHVPVGSDLARAARSREEAELEEKEHVKQLTLNMTHRMEEEERLQAEIDFKENLFQLTPRRGGGSGGGGAATSTRFHHPRGAPNTAQIYNNWRT